MLRNCAIHRVSLPLCQYICEVKETIISIEYIDMSIIFTDNPSFLLYQLTLTITPIIGYQYGKHFQSEHD